MTFPRGYPYSPIVDLSLKIIIIKIINNSSFTCKLNTLFLITGFFLRIAMYDISWRTLILFGILFQILEFVDASKPTGEKKTLKLQTF